MSNNEITSHFNVIVVLAISIMIALSTALFLWENLEMPSLQYTSAEGKEKVDLSSLLPSTIMLVVSIGVAGYCIWYLSKKTRISSKN